MENNKTNNKKPETEKPLQECNKKSKKMKAPRCPYLGCNKKIKHIMGHCKCKVSFCLQHRLPHLHSCKVDLKVTKLEFIKNNGLGGINIKQFEVI